jgi:hypothetical protein
MDLTRKYSLFALIPLYFFTSTLLLGDEGAFSVPISDKVFCGVIFTRGAKAFGFCSRDGSMLTIKKKHSKETLGVALAQSSDGKIFALPLRIEHLQRGGDIVSQDGAPVGIKIKENTIISTTSMRAVIVVQSVSQWKFLTAPGAGNLRPSQLQRRFGTSGGGSCCLTCGDVTVCTTLAKGACGSCKGASIQRK